MFLISIWLAASFRCYILISIERGIVTAAFRKNGKRINRKDEIAGEQG